MTAPADSTSNEHSAASKGKSRRWWLVLLVFATLGGGAFGVWKVMQKPALTTASPPDVDLSRVSREVSQAVQKQADAVTEEPDSADAWGNLGMVLYAHSFNGEAGDCFAEAARLAPTNSQWPYLRGMLLAESDITRGLALIEEASQLEPDNPYLHLRLAEFYFDLGRYEDSRKKLGQALRLDPESARAEFGMARIELAAGNPTESLQWATKAELSAGPRIDILQLLSQVHHQLGNRSEAQKYGQMVQERMGENRAWPDPLLAKVYLLRADTGRLIEFAEQMLKQDNLDEHLRQLYQLVYIEPEVPTWHVDLGKGLLRVRDLDNAGRVLDKGLELHPRSAEMHFFRAVVHHNQQEFEQAVEQLKEALAIKPDYEEAYYHLSYCQRQLKQVADAEKSLSKVLEYEPLHVEANLDLAELLFEKDRDAALAHVHKAMQVEPENIRAKALLARAK